MPDLNETEKRIIKHFKKQYRASIGEAALEELYLKGIKQLYGEGARDPRITVDWKAFFDKNICPFCRGRVSLKQRGYFCGDCSVAFDQDEYDRAKASFEKTGEILKDENAIRELISKEKIRPIRLEGLYSTALEQVRAEIDEEKRKNALIEDEKRGISLKKSEKIEGDEK